MEEKRECLTDVELDILIASALKEIQKLCEQMELHIDVMADDATLNAYASNIARKVAYVSAFRSLKTKGSMPRLSKT